jgi:dTDP-4-dehydrorhamnose 3,5-epimerase
MTQIEGVEIKKLVTHVDERGFFREVIRVTDDFFGEGFGQWSHSLMYPGVAKAWHIHPHQIDWWYVPIGTLKVALHDRRDASPTRGETMELFLGENAPAAVLKIPPGVAHGCKAIGGTAHLFYVTSRTYDPKEEGRIAHDDPEIGYDWLAGPTIK